MTAPGWFSKRLGPHSCYWLWHAAKYCNNRLRLQPAASRLADSANSALITGCGYYGSHVTQNRLKGLEHVGQDQELDLGQWLQPPSTVKLLSLSKALKSHDGCVQLGKVLLLDYVQHDNLVVPTTLRTAVGA